MRCRCHYITNPSQLYTMSISFHLKSRHEQPWFCKCSASQSRSHISIVYAVYFFKDRQPFSSSSALVSKSCTDSNWKDPLGALLPSLSIHEFSMIPKLLLLTFLSWRQPELVQQGIERTHAVNVDSIDAPWPKIQSICTSIDKKRCSIRGFENHNPSPKSHHSRIKNDKRVYPLTNDNVASRAYSDLLVRRSSIRWLGSSHRGQQDFSARG